MFIHSSTPATSGYFHTPNGNGARNRQKDDEIRTQPAKGPVQQSEGQQRARAQRVGGVPKDAALSSKEQEDIKRLKKRDAEVRQHERAHLSAGGAYAKGPPTYDYETGPDGKRYAIGGHVNIDSSPIPGDPKATIQKARIIKRAALAPKDPSNLDHQVAQEAVRMERKARHELEMQRREELSRQTGPASNSSDTIAAGKLSLPNAASAPSQSYSVPDASHSEAGFDSSQSKGQVFSNIITDKDAAIRNAVAGIVNHKVAPLRPGRLPTISPTSGPPRRLASPQNTAAFLNTYSKTDPTISTDHMDASLKLIRQLAEPPSHFDRYA